MSISELYQGLVATGLPVTYYDWTTAEKVPDLPYIAYLFSYNRSLMADDTNLLDVGIFQVELYTDKKDLVNEKKVEDKLKELYLPYQKTETRLDTERMFQIVYEIELI